MKLQTDDNSIEQFICFLRTAERSANTITKYARDVRSYLVYLRGDVLSKESVIGWKEQLIKNYAPSSVNSMLAAINCFLDWLELPQFKVKPLKIQRSLFTEPEKELTYEEYKQLVRIANQSENKRLAVLLQTIGSTGIRVPELQYITVESLQTGRATVRCKGKTRLVFLTSELCKALKIYCREKKIKSGMIFCTKSGKALDRSNIWKEMKALCDLAGVSTSKVFPHNLRHLFARSYYKIEKDLSRLADILGHSNVSTTRIYTADSGQVHEKQLEKMKMVLLQI